MSTTGGTKKRTSFGSSSSRGKTRTPPAPPKRGPKGKTGGTGKKQKVFAEELGMQHLLDLSNDIASHQAERLDKRVDKAMEKKAWQKERNARKNGGGGGKAAERTGANAVESDASQQQKAANVAPMTKSSARAGLVSKQREKARMRKEARKAAHAAGGRKNKLARLANDANLLSSDEAKPVSISSSPSTKRVTFA